MTDKLRDDLLDLIGSIRICIQGDDPTTARQHAQVLLYALIRAQSTAEESASQNRVSKILEAM